MPPDQAAASVKIALDRIRKQLSDDHLKVVLAELVQPIQAEVTELREKLAQGSKKSKFEVSLSQIPPELEQQLELRLRNELGPQVLKEAREQSEQVLQTAKTAIEQNFGKLTTNFGSESNGNWKPFSNRREAYRPRSARICESI